MSSSISLWIGLTLVCIFIQSFYSMLEMAIVSFNKVRLQYWVDKGVTRARWISQLIQHPARLFGTTLLGVNIALQIGSECSRLAYVHMGADPNIAWISQFFLVLIFAELSPMFAARRYSENVAMLGIPIIYASSWILRPVIWLIGIISTVANRLVGGPRGPILNVLSREELQHLVEERDVTSQPGTFNALIANIFSFRKKVARDVMTPIDRLHMLPNTASVGDVAHLLKQYDVPCIPLHERTRRNVVGIAFPRDLIGCTKSSPVRPHARSPWFITQSTPIGQILRQFRYNNESVAIILDQNGRTVGLLTLDDIIEELFGEEPTSKRPLKSHRQLFERSFPANTLLADFNTEVDANLKGDREETLAQFLTANLGHPPEKGETVRIGNLEIKVVETTLMGLKTVEVRSLR